MRVLLVPEIKLPSVFDLFPRREGQNIARALTEHGKDHGLHVSDLGDEDALRDFRRNARRCSQGLYRFIGDSLESGWFVRVYDQWKQSLRGHVDRLPQRVLP